MPYLIKLEIFQTQPFIIMIIVSLKIYYILVSFSEKRKYFWPICCQELFLSSFIGYGCYKKSDQHKISILMSTHTYIF